MSRWAAIICALVFLHVPGAHAEEGSTAPPPSFQDDCITIDEQDDILRNNFDPLALTFTMNYWEAKALYNAAVASAGPPPTPLGDFAFATATVVRIIGQGPVVKTRFFDDLGCRITDVGVMLSVAAFSNIMWGYLDGIERAI